MNRLLASDLPPDLHSRISPALVLAAFGVIVAASVVYAVYLAVRRRDVVPLVVCVGALICALNEPIYDILDKIVYADNHPMAYTYFVGCQLGLGHRDASANCCDSGGRNAIGENHRKFLELEGNTRLQASAHVSTSRS